MAKFAATDYKITVAGVDFSTNLNSVELSQEADDLETTAFGQSWRSRIGGLNNASITLNFMQDFAAANVEATIFPLVGTTTTVTVKASSAATSATNPIYTLTGCFLAAHTPVASAVGELAMTSLSFTGGVLTKATA